MNLSSDDDNKEWEARANAIKVVGQLVQRPDQLEKIDHYKRQATRKQAAVDAMLKTAVQSQLDGVRSGLAQLKTALSDIKQIDKNLEEVQKSCQKLQGLQEKLKPIHELSQKHGEYYAAVEHFKHIFTVPETVKRTEELITEGDLLVAHTHIRELEASRDDLMLELHKHGSRSEADQNRLIEYFAGVPKLSDRLLREISTIMERVTASLRHDPTVVVSCLRVIEREEKADAAALRLHDQYGFLAPNRPKKWQKKLLEKLASTVENRIAGCQIETRDGDKMWLVRHFELVRQITLDDLRTVKMFWDVDNGFVRFYLTGQDHEYTLELRFQNVFGQRRLCPPAFPPKWNIVERFVTMYHEAISEHLGEVIQNGLEGNEVVTLLSWVFNTYYGAEMMNHEDLGFDVRASCGELLDEETMSLLKTQYMEQTRRNMSEWVENTMQSEGFDWYRDQAPDSDGRGFYITQLPVILFEMMEQNLAVAAHISSEFSALVLTVCLRQVLAFCARFRAELTDYHDGHVRDRTQNRFFLHYIIANANNCQAFIDFTESLQRRHQLAADSIENGQVVAGVRENFAQVAFICCKWAQEELFFDLSEHSKKILTREWLTGGSATVWSLMADTICLTIEDYHTDFTHLRRNLYDQLMRETYTNVMLLYISSVTSPQRRVAFRTFEERRAGGERMESEAKQIHALVSRLAPSAIKEGDVACEAVENLAEILKMEDCSLISLVVTSIVKQFKDIQTEQLVNCLCLRDDVTARDAKTMVEDAMASTGDRGHADGLFSRALMLRCLKY